MKWLCRIFRGRPQYRVEVFPSAAEWWHWRIRHQNGNILATSEAYSSRGAAWDTAENLAASVGWLVSEVDY